MRQRTHAEFLSPAMGSSRRTLAFVVPTLTLGSSVIALGSSTMLAWSTIDPTSTSCTASANPATNFTAPAPAASGSITVTPAAAGATVYTLTCTGAGGTSASNSVTLFATSGTPAGDADAHPRIDLGRGGQIDHHHLELGERHELHGVGKLERDARRDAAARRSPRRSSAPRPSRWSVRISAARRRRSSVTLDATSALVKPPAPTLTLGASSITADTTTQLSWSSARRDQLHSLGEHERQSKRLERCPGAERHVHHHAGNCGHVRLQPDVLECRRQLADVDRDAHRDRPHDTGGGGGARSGVAVGARADASCFSGGGSMPGWPGPGSAAPLHQHPLDAAGVGART